MLNLVLGLAAIILGGIILVTLAQIAFAAYLWFNRKKLAKSGLKSAETLLEGMGSIAEGLDKTMDNVMNKEEEKEEV